MKKLLFLVVLLVFMGCSSTQINKNQKKDIAICKQYYDNWELDKLNIKIHEIKTYDIKLATDLAKSLEERKNQKKELEILLQNMKQSIKLGHINEIEKNFQDTIANRELMKYLKENNSLAFDIIIGKIKFYKETAKNMIGLVYLDQVIYLSVDYKLLKNNWRIKRWKLTES